MRIEELKKKLQEEELDAYLGVANAQYLSGTPASSAVITTAERSILLCKRLEFDRAERETGINDIRAFARTEVPLREGEKIIFGKMVKAIGEVLSETGSERVGYDQLSPAVLDQLQKQHEAEYERNPDLVWDLRKIKTQQELESMEKSARIALKGMERASELMEIERSEIEIAAEAEYTMRKSGSGGTPFDTIVASGENSWIPHAGATGRRLKKGDLITVDLGATFEGYNSDMTRTFAISPDSEQKKILRTTREAQKAALQEVKSGVEAKQIDERIRKVFRESGLEKFCLHGSGHGVGLDVHEQPNLAPDSEEILEKGMVITIEPGIYIKGVGGARFEDMIVVTKDGYEMLTRSQIHQS